jgi:hypothetical protein
MTDLDTMLAMLQRATIEYNREVIREGLKHGGCTMLEIERGYAGFVSQLIFNPNGDLVSIEAYE